ncbi:MAG: tetratricopeptide repeat protein [Flavobacteriales bacterium]
MNKLIYLCLLGFLAACKLQQPVAVQPDPTYIRQFHSGVRHMLNEQHDDAIQDFKACLLKQPKDAAVHYALFQTYLKQERYEEAAYHTEQAAKLDPQNLHYKRELAFMYAQLGKLQEAANVFETLLKSDPKNIDFYSGALKCYDELKKPAKSLALIEKMEQQLGANPNTVLEKYGLLLAMGKPKDGVAVLEAGRLEFPSEPSILANLVDHYFRAQDYTAGFGLLKDLVEADPNNGVALLMYGEMLYRSGKTAEGKKFLYNGILADGPSLDQKMNILIMLVNEKRQGPIDTGIEPLVSYLAQAYPNEAKAHSIAGDYYYVSGQTQLAIESYRQTLRCDPNLYPVWNQVLILEFEQGNWTTLQKDATTCAELFPTQALPLFFKALTLNRSGAFAAAIENLAAAQSVLLNDNALLSEIKCQLGLAYFGLKNTDKALLQFKEALQLSPGNIAIELTYLHALAKQQIEPSKTHERLAELALQNSANSRCAFEYAYSFLQLGQYAQALEWQLKITEQKFVQSPIYQEQLGDIYFFLGQAPEALACWKKAFELGEGSSVLSEKITKKTYVQVP